MYSSFYWPPL